MYKDQMDIGYCLSQAVGDYGVSMDAEICLLLSNPLWLGLNLADEHTYSPMAQQQLTYFYPFFLESFSVNTNCLFLPVRGSSAAHFEYLVMRLQRNKKVLVKVSSLIFEQEKGGEAPVQSPVLAIVDRISLNAGATERNVNLVFSASYSLQLSEQEFMEYWCGSPASKINTEWFAIIPSQSKPTAALMRLKLQSAFTRQYYNLKSNPSMLSGVAVLEYLQCCLRGETGRYPLPEHQTRLWSTLQGIIPLREKYAASLAHADFVGETEGSRLRRCLMDSAQAWAAFFEDIQICPVAGDKIGKHYQTMIALENELINDFEKIL